MKTKKSNSAIYLFILAVFIFAGCKVPQVGEADIAKQDLTVAVIDSSVNIKASHLYQRLAASNLLEKGGILDSSTYFDTLAAIVMDSIVALEAKNVDIRKDFGIYRTYLLRYKDYFLNYFYKKYIVDSVKVDSVTVDSFYRAHLDMFTVKEQVRARQLVISAAGLRYGPDSVLYKKFNQDQLDSVAMDFIYKLRQRIDSGEILGNLAHDYSMHKASAEKYGELGYFPRRTYNEEFEKQAFSLPPGAISRPFRSPDGWHLIEVIDHKDSSLMPLTGQAYVSALRQCTSDQAVNRVKRLIDSLTSNAEIIYNDSALNQESYGIPVETWAAIVNGRDTISFYGLADIFVLYGANQKLDTLTLADKHIVLLKEAQRALLLRAGADLGFASDPPVVAEREKLYDKAARQLVAKSSRDPDFSPSDSMIADYYYRNIDIFINKKPIYVQHIIVSDSLFGEFLREQALTGINFLELAKQYYPGAEEIRSAAADLGYIGPGDMPDNFYNTAVSTPEGAVSHPIKTEWGYHIIKVLDYKRDKGLEQARAVIVDSLRMAHASEVGREWTKNLLDRHRVEYHLDRIRRVELPAKSLR
jgi:hypothetical protein